MTQLSFNTSTSVLLPRSSVALHLEGPIDSAAVSNICSEPTQAFTTPIIIIIIIIITILCKPQFSNHVNLSLAEKRGDLRNGTLSSLVSIL